MKTLILSLMAITTLAACSAQRPDSPPFRQPARTQAPAEAPTDLVRDARTDVDMARAMVKPAHLPDLEGIRGDGQPARLPQDFASPHKLVALVLRPDGIAPVNAARQSVADTIKAQPTLSSYQVVILEAGMEAFARFAQPMLEQAQLTTPYPFVFGMVTYTNSADVLRALERDDTPSVLWVLLNRHNKVEWQSTTFAAADVTAVKAIVQQR